MDVSGKDRVTVTNPAFLSLSLLSHFIPVRAIYNPSDYNPLFAPNSARPEAIALHSCKSHPTQEVPNLHTFWAYTHINPTHYSRSYTLKFIPLDLTLVYRFVNLFFKIKNETIIMERITQFREKYYFLNNLYHVNVYVLGTQYSSVERAYLASLSPDPTWRKQCINEPLQVLWSLSNYHKLEYALNDATKIDIMLGLLQQKFRYPELRMKLIQTGDTELVYTCNNRYWGVNHKGDGRNLLGITLMKLRDVIKAEEEESRHRTEEEEAMFGSFNKMVNKLVSNLPPKPPVSPEETAMLEMYPKPNVTRDLTLITPEYAQHLLKGNTNNRKVSSVYQAIYEKDMREGKWQYNGMAIVISKTGRILDGQHRLISITRAGTPLWMDIVRGVDDSAFATIDSGKGRTVNDHFVAANILNSAAMSSLTSALIRYMDGHHCPMQGTSILSDDYTPQSLIHFYNVHSERMQESHRFAAKMMRPNRDVFRNASNRYFAFFHFLLSEVDKEKAEEFLEKIAYGEMIKKTSPEYAVRQELCKVPMDVLTTIHRRETLTIAAWEHFISGDKKRFKFVYDTSLPIKINGASLHLKQA